MELAGLQSFLSWASWWAACWATVRGYVPPVWAGWGCSDVAYPSPQPAFAELVDRYGESPYCARRIRGEEWF